MGNIVVWHGKNRDLGDGSVAAFDTTGTFVDGGQIRIHVTGETAAAGNFFASSRDLTQGITVGREIGENDQDVLFELIGVVLGSGQGETGGDNTFDAGL